MDAVQRIPQPRLVLDEGWIYGMTVNTISILDGEPVVLVHDGVAVEANLRRERSTTEERRALARLEQLASLDEIAYAVLETGGRISLIPRRSR